MLSLAEKTREDCGRKLLDDGENMEELKNNARNFKNIFFIF
jgi:hypothetical protein